MLNLLLYLSVLGVRQVNFLLLVFYENVILDVSQWHIFLAGKTGATKNAGNYRINLSTVLKHTDEWNYSKVFELIRKKPCLKMKFNSRNEQFIRSKD